MWGIAQRPNNAAKGTRAAEDAGGAGGAEEKREEKRSTVPAATQIERLQASLLPHRAGTA